MVQPSHFCDSDHPRISAFARGLAKGSSDEHELIDASFRAVRELVRFGFDRVATRASDTLQKGYGACYNKSLLLVGILRANQIPCVFAARQVDREFMRPALGRYCLLLNQPYWHCLVKVRVADTWIELEPTLDSATYGKLWQHRAPDWHIEWDGHSSMVLYREHVCGAPLDILDIDSHLARNLGNRELPAPLARLFYARLNRRMWQRVDARQLPPRRRSPDGAV